jgi:hypothetical protein
LEADKVALADFVIFMILSQEKSVVLDESKKLLKFHMRE